MRCLTNSEIHKWLSGQGMHHQPMDCGVPVAGDYPIPLECHGRLMLADYLADLLSKDGNKLLEILPCAIQNAEACERLGRLRAGHGETRSLAIATGHLFKSRDRQDFPGLLCHLLGGEGGWSFYIYSAPSRTTLLVEDRIGVWTPKKGVRNELGRYLAASMAE